MGADTLHITTDNFESELGAGAAVVDFHATWCGPCKQIAPIMDELASDYKEQGLKVGKVDIDEAQELASRFGITGVPTIIFFKDGEVVDQLVGAHAKPVIEGKLSGILG